MNRQRKSELKEIRTQGDIERERETVIELQRDTSRKRSD